MLDRVRSFAETYQMIQPGGKVAAGISGGPDSVCLLLLLKELCREQGADLYAVHVHHGLRGAEADGDEAFVRELCAREQIPLRVFSFDVRERAAREGRSLEEAGRLCGTRHSGRRQKGLAERALPWPITWMTRQRLCFSGCSGEPGFWACAAWSLCGGI